MSVPDLGKSYLGLVHGVHRGVILQQHPASLGPALGRGTVQGGPQGTVPGHTKKKL